MLNHIMSRDLKENWGWFIAGIGATIIVGAIIIFFIM